MSSHLERYIETVVVEAVDAINAAQPPVSKLPIPLRVIQIEQSCLEVLTLFDDNRRSKRRGKASSDTSPIKEFRDSHQQRLDKIRRLVDDHKWFWDDNNMITNIKVHMLIAGNNFSNPSPDKIRELFWHFGVDDIVADATASCATVTSLDVARKVSELIDKRNEIAHTSNTSAPLTPEDVVIYVRCARRLVRGIDLALGEAVRKASNAWPWQSSSEALQDTY